MNLLASLATISFFNTTLYGVTVYFSCRLCFYLRLYRKWLNISTTQGTLSQKHHV